MKSINVIPFMLALCLLAGCVHSVHGIADESTLVYDEALIGEWAVPGEGDRWSFEGDGDSYQLSYTDIEGNVGRFHGALCNINGKAYLDFVPNIDGQFDASGMNAFWFFHLRPMHNFMRLELAADSLRLYIIDPDWFEGYLQTNPAAPAHERSEGGAPVLTAKPAELQNFIIAMESIEQAWGQPLELTRLAGSDTAQPTDE